MWTSTWRPALLLAAVACAPAGLEESSAGEPSRIAPICPYESFVVSPDADVQVSWDTLTVDLEGGTIVSQSRLTTVVQFLYDLSLVELVARCGDGTLWDEPEVERRSMNQPVGTATYIEHMLLPEEGQAAVLGLFDFDADYIDLGRLLFATSEDATTSALEFR